MIALQSNADYIHMEIDLTDICTYSCSYCGNYGGKDLIDANVLIDFLKRTRKETNKEVYVSLLGGEPSLHPNFSKLIKELKLICKGGITVVSNAYRSLQWWRDHSDYIIDIVLSYHIEHAKYIEFAEKAKFLSENKIITINVMMLPSRFDECFYIANDLLKITKNAYISPKPIMARGEMHQDYTEEHIKKMSIGMIGPSNPTVSYSVNPLKLYKILPNGVHERTRTQWIITNKENSFKDWLCWIGVTTLKIKANGDIYRGICMVKSNEPIGNIYSQFNLPTKPIVCEKNWCSCASDIKYARKEKVYERNR